MHMVSTHSQFPSLLAAQPVTGVVMAGGFSSRMGQDKTQLSLNKAEYADLLGRTARILQEVVGTVCIVGREHPDYPSFSDDEPGLGPVGGIATCLRRTGTACLVLSCDLPFMTTQVVRRLLELRNQSPAETLVTCYKQQETGYSEPLVAVYEAGAFPYFQECANKRLLKINRIVPEDRQQFLLYGMAESLPFFNVNYPADLEAARRILMAGGEG